MHRIQLHYTLQSTPSTGLIHHPLLDLLEAVAAQGSISGAARALGLSYRNVWGALKKWEHQLGCALIVWGKGRTAQLSDDGARLLATERHTQALLAPHIEAIQTALERGLAQGCALHTGHD